MNFDYIEKSDFLVSLAGIYVSLYRLICTEYEIGTNACLQDTFRASA
jgi:hypothetical protein